MLLARDFDKSMRLATNPHAFGESPFIDKAGYAILGAHMHQGAHLHQQQRKGITYLSPLGVSNERG
jgi:hypothetical protein